MAELALAAPSAATPEPEIKKEPDPTELEALDFPLPPKLSSKRPFDDINATSETSEAKRAKGKTETDEASLEDGLALLVQNALSNVDDLVNQFTIGNDAPDLPPSDSLEVDTTTTPRADLSIVYSSFFSEPLKHIQDVNLHALGNLAFSILLILVQSPFEDTTRLLRSTDSEHQRSFQKLKAAFENVRQLYSSGSVLSADQLEISDTEARTFIELANLAQLGLLIINGSKNALSDADEYFLALLQCQLSDLSHEMTELYLSIKTQRAIEVLVDKELEKPPEEAIGEILTRGLEETLREQSSSDGGGELNSADQKFVYSVQTRKETLQGEIKEQAEPAALRDKHPADDLLGNYLNYARGKLKSLQGLGKKLGISMQLKEHASEPERTVEATSDGDSDLDDLSSLFEKTASGLVQNALAGLTDEPDTPAIAAAATTTAPTERETPASASNTDTKSESLTTRTNTKIDIMTDYKELEALVAESTSNYVKTTLNGLSPVPYQPTMPTSTADSLATHLPCLAQLQHHQAQNPYYTYTHPPSEPQQSSASKENLPPNQTFPSAILYDKARQAALSKSSAHTRREGLHSARRPWTQEEEKALMAGLDMVKGPHWSQILTLFGHNGTISDILKDRTQVQLKDKARNLKLFFLKTNSEMPYYLQAVTGELKTRAPTQAARKEAEERARLNSEEDQAKLQGIMTLAGGLQHPPPTSSSTATAVGAGAATTQGQSASAAQAAAASNQQPKVSHQAHAAGPNTHASISIPRPMATPASQIRPGVQTNTQHLLHAVAQAHQRAQPQLPRQVTRPQGQQPPQSPRTQSQQPQQRDTSRQPKQGQTQQAEPLQHSTSSQSPTTNGQGSTEPAVSQESNNVPLTQKPTTSSPIVSTLHASASAATASTPAEPQREHEQQPAPEHSAAQSEPPAHSAESGSSPTLPQQPQLGPEQEQEQEQEQEKPRTEISSQQEQNDNVADAALLEGLQAVVAPTLAS